MSNSKSKNFLKILASFVGIASASTVFILPTFALGNFTGSSPVEISQVPPPDQEQPPQPDQEQPPQPDQEQPPQPNQEQPPQ